MNLMLQQSSLSSAGDGERLACAVIKALLSMESVSLDFAGVESMTPSYANAFVMTVLHAMSADDLPDRLHMKNLSVSASQAIQRAVQRYQSGIRLSTQRTPQARSA